MFKIESLETDSKNFVSFVVKKFIGFLIAVLIGIIQSSIQRNACSGKII